VTGPAQAWITNPAELWIIVKGDGLVGVEYRFNSSEYSSDAALRPILTIEYMANAPTPTSRPATATATSTATQTRTAAITATASRTRSDGQRTAPTGTHTPTLEPIDPAPTATATATFTATRTAAPSPSATPTAGAAQTTIFQQGWEAMLARSDTSLDGWNPGTNYGAYVQLMMRSDNWQDGLVSFDLTSISAQARVDRAVLALYATSAVAPMGLVVSAHQLLRPWVDVEANWTLARAATPGTRRELTRGGPRSNAGRLRHAE